MFAKKTVKHTFGSESFQKKKCFQITKNTSGNPFKNPSNQHDFSKKSHVMFKKTQNKQSGFSKKKQGISETVKG